MYVLGANNFGTKQFATVETIGIAYILGGNAYNFQKGTNGTGRLGRQPRGCF
jgi:hypothetical protein